MSVTIYRLCVDGDMENCSQAYRVAQLSGTPFNYFNVMPYKTPDIYSV